MNEDLVFIIKRDCLEARKAKDKLKSNLLVTLVGEIEMVAKNAQREVTDADCIAKVKAFRKNLTEMLNHATDNDQRASLCIEFNTLEKYLPTQMNENELSLKILDIIDTCDYQEMKDMGKIMSELKGQYDGQYDGKLASGLVKQLLQDLNK